MPAGGIELATQDLALQQTTNSTLVSTTACKRCISPGLCAQMTPCHVIALQYYLLMSIHYLSKYYLQMSMQVEPLLLPLHLRSYS